MKHGTRGGYCNHGCRCEACATANRDYQREYRQRRYYEHVERGLCGYCSRPISEFSASLCRKHLDYMRDWAWEQRVR